MSDSGHPGGDDAADLFAGAVVVPSIAAEYEFLQQQRCPACGHGYGLVRQALTHHADRPYDLLEVRCAGCGASRRFAFDISSFFGQYS
jgi:hypothetical protein